MNIADKIAADMRALPKAARKEIRPRLRRAGDIMAADTRSRANWSTRIPGTVKVRTSFRLDREGVEVTVGGNAAPHARAYEGITGKAEFRHPVHANPKKPRTEWTWVAEPTRPFLIPAAQAIEGPTTAMVEAALLAAAAALGFRE